MLHYCGPIFLPQVANAISGDDPRAGLQMGQGTTTFVSGKADGCHGWYRPQPTTHQPRPSPSLRTLSGAARNSSRFKVSALALAR